MPISGVKMKGGLTKEVNLYQADGEVQHTEVGEEMLGFLNKFQEIEEKNRCLRVQFLDWLSDKLLDWSNKCHVMSVKIDSPCVIKVEPRKKEQSNDAKERAEIAKLKENLKRLTEENSKLWDDRLEKQKAAAVKETARINEVLKEVAESAEFKAVEKAEKEQKETAK